MDKVVEVYECTVELFEKDAVRMKVSQVLPETTDVPDIMASIDRADIDVDGELKRGQILYWILGIEYDDEGVKRRFSKFKKPNWTTDVDLEQLFEKAQKKAEELRGLFETS